ncbi:MAG TPA: helix-turn-helix domain-containing protein [Gaiellaceae bacterium]|nr:helix-turn-helix domain-containing protein [Gaiellaceae bacterium]
MSSEGKAKTWTFVTNHTQVLLCIAREPDVRLRDIAQTVGITERAVQRIVADLAQAGYLERERVGRRSRYLIRNDVTMRHPAQAEHEIGELLRLLSLNTPPSKNSANS